MKKISENLRTCRMALMALFVGLLLLAANAGFAQDETVIPEVTKVPLVTTDKLDYEPGETVYITASGFHSNENVLLTIVHIEPNMPDPWHEHATATVTTDADGNFTAEWYVDIIELNTTLLLTADGLNEDGSFTGEHAETVFTDGVGSATIVTPTGFSTINVAPGGTVSVPYAFTYGTSGTGGNQTTSITYKVYLRSGGNDYLIAGPVTQTGLTNGTHTVGSAAAPLTASVTFNGTGGNPPGTGGESYNLKIEVTKNNGGNPGSTSDNSSGTWVQVGAGNKFASLTVGSQVETGQCNTASTVTFPINVVRGNSNSAINGTLTLTGSGTNPLPAGVISSASFSPNPVVADANAAIETPSSTLTLTFSTLLVGVYDFSVTVADGSNSTTGNGTLTVIDNIAPVVSQQNGSSTVECLSAAVAPTVPTASDNCDGTINGVLVSTIDYVNGVEAEITCEGTRVYKYAYSDNAAPANVSYWTYTYTIKRTTDPAIVSRPEKSLSEVECAANATVPVVLPVVEDVCQNILSPVDDTPAPAYWVMGESGWEKYVGDVKDFCKGKITYTFNYEDCAGLKFDWTYTYLIDRITHPSETGRPEKNLSEVECAAEAVVPQLPVVEDVCGNVIPAPTPEITSDITNCEGTVTYKYTYVDCAGLDFVWTYKYIVDDTQAPKVLTKNKTVYLDAFGNASIVIDDINNGTTDNCNGTIEYSLDKTTFTCSDFGEVIVTLTATDCAGNTASNTATVYVEDNIPPVVPEPKGGYVELSANCTGAYPDLLSGWNVTDNCTVTKEQHPAAGTPYTEGEGEKTVTLTASAPNFVISVDVIVYFDDKTAPEISCPEDQIVVLDDMCFGTLPDYTGMATVSDNCKLAENINVTQSTQNGNTVFSGDQNVLVTLTANDGNNNQNACSFNVHFKDETPPVITAAPVNVNNDPKLCSAIVDAKVTVTDNCGQQDPTGVRSDGLKLTDPYPVGTTTITWNVVDVNYNPADPVKQLVTVTDNEAPALVGVPADAPASCSAIPDVINPTATDNCDPNPVVHYLGEVSTQDPDPTVPGHYSYTLTRTWNATDVAENTSATGTQVITVTDGTAPTAICQSITVNLDDEGNASITPSEINNGSTDNCSPVILVSVEPFSFTCENTGLNTVALTVKDVTGNKATCEAEVNVKDVTAPSAICTRRSSVNLDETGTASIDPEDIDAGSTDNCGIVKWEVSKNTFTCGDLGSTSVTLTVIDASNNSSYCTTSITVYDRIPPVAICKNATVYLDIDGTVEIGPAAVNNGSYDNCSTHTNVYPRDFDCSNIGNNTVTFTIWDKSNNQSSCTANVTVLDETDPVIETLEAIVVDADAGVCSYASSQLTPPDASDNCSVNVTFSPSSLNLGPNTVTWTATDGSGNTATSEQTVNVVDNQDPTASNPAPVNVECFSDIPAPDPSVVTDEADNCGTPSVTFVNDDVVNALCDGDVVAVTRKYKVMDGSSNVIYVYQTINVDDVTPPTVLTKPAAVTLDLNGNASITVASVNNGTNDNCDGDLTYRLSQSTFTCADAPGKTVTLYAKDCALNEGSNTAYVTINQRTTKLVINTLLLAGEYSDPVSLKATLTDLSTGTKLSGKTVNFQIGTQTATGITDGNGVATATITLNQAPGVYTLSASFAGDCPFMAITATKPFVIVQERACATYTGVLTASTGSVNSTKATLLLSATVVADGDGNTGDIRNALVSFLANGVLIKQLPVGLVNPNDISVGSAATEYVYDLGTQQGATVTIAVIISGYYRNKLSGECFDITEVTISKPGTDFITGGGYLVLESGKHTGTVKADDNSKNNFGFNVKYNKKGTSLQGNINTIIRKTVAETNPETGETENVVHKIQVKGTALSSLAISNSINGEFTGKAVAQDVTDPKNVVSISGNFLMKVLMTDNGEPGTNDLLSVTVFDKDGGVYFSSRWENNQPVKQKIASGNLQVNPSALKSGVIESVEITTAVKPEIIAEPGLKVYPNPFSEKLRFEFVSPESVNARVDLYDMTGRLVKNIFEQPIDGGVSYEAEFRPETIISGMYIYRVTLGEAIYNGKVVFKKE